jgi:glycosyltransferase involved in cell wall biosynthesis
MNTKKLTHAIFNNFEPHGDRYNYNSHWLYKKALFSKHRATRDCDISKLMYLHRSPYELNSKIPISWVPHIVESKTGDGAAFRSKYSIGKSNTVLGRIGGINEFNDIAAINGIIELLEKKKDLFCVFVNTKHFYTHKRLIYLDYLSNEEKWDFYSACDLLVNGRLMGESFGFAVCEALASGKPIIAPSAKRNKRMDRNHIRILKDRELLYNSQKDFVRKVLIQLKSPTKSDILRSKVDNFTAKDVSKVFFERFLLD